MPWRLRNFDLWQKVLCVSVYLRAGNGDCGDSEFTGQGAVVHSLMLPTIKEGWKPDSVEGHQYRLCDVHALAESQTCTAPNLGSHSEELSGKQSSSTSTRKDPRLPESYVSRQYEYTSIVCIWGLGSSYPTVLTCSLLCHYLPQYWKPNEVSLPVHFIGD